MTSARPAPCTLHPALVVPVCCKLEARGMSLCLQVWCIYWVLLSKLFWCLVLAGMESVVPTHSLFLSLFKLPNDPPGYHFMNIIDRVGLLPG